LEIVAAWGPLTGDYARAREQIESAIAGRKHLREFSAWASLRGAVERSSLDGGRETVLAARSEGPVAAARLRLGIRPAEQLDAVSLCKRAGGDPEQFVPTPNIALARWIEQASETAPREMEALRRACQSVKVRRVQDAGRPWWSALPFYADVLLESQVAQVLDEAGYQGELTAKQWFDRHVGPLLRHMREPHGYLAALVADGDHMGRAIEHLRSPDEHRRFSEVLAGFAEDARAIVESRHRGELVYAGGDDVLAMVCPTDALSCARELREAFRQRMGAFTATCALPEVPTLSVGLGIAHRTEGLGDLVQLGREAEQLAKQPPEPHGEASRNALAVIVTPRSGQRRSWRARWADGQRCPVEQLQRDMACTTLPMSKVHAIEDMVRRLRGAEPAVLRGEVLRILAHTADGAEKCSPQDVGLELDLHGSSAVPLEVTIQRFVERQLVARVFSRAVQSTVPKQEHAR
ncbi:MAG: type III-B CRISPR-associated protein Cas10/Cmr2, partial [Myxococcales bacterium]|nr:type III-B CRISPR-associated protein Cas10/Cmr2 [Myxococcales bacterium]